MHFYSLKNSVALVKGVPITGYAEGDDVIAGDREVDGFNHTVGADGNMLVTQDANESGMIIFKLQQGSPSNAYLGGLYAQQERGVFAALDCRVIDTTNGEQIGGAKGYIKRPSPVTRGTNGNVQEWQIAIENYDAVFTALPEL